MGLGQSGEGQLFDCLILEPIVTPAEGARAAAAADGWRIWVTHLPLKETKGTRRKQDEQKCIWLFIEMSQYPEKKNSQMQLFYDPFSTDVTFSGLAEELRSLIFLASRP